MHIRDVCQRGPALLPFRARAVRDKAFSRRREHRNTFYSGKKVMDYKSEIAFKSLDYLQKNDGAAQTPVIELPTVPRIRGFNSER